MSAADDLSWASCPACGGRLVPSRAVPAAEPAVTAGAAAPDLHETGRGSSPPRCRRGARPAGLRLRPRGADAAAALNLPVQRVGIETASVPPGSVDVVTLWQVLEHLEDPAGALTEIEHNPFGLWQSLVNRLTHHPPTSATCWGETPGSLV